MEIEFTPRAKTGIRQLAASWERKIASETRELIESIQATPFKGIGKPELLKYDLAGKWSRRISKADRLVYEVNENLIRIFSVKGHYE